MANLVADSPVLVRLTRTGTGTSEQNQAVVDSILPSVFFRAQTFTSGADDKVTIKGVQYDLDTMAFINSED